MTEPGLPVPERSVLMGQHREARGRRDAATLGSVAHREASEDVARIEVAIAAMEQPPPSRTSPAAAEAERKGV